MLGRKIQPFWEQSLEMYSIVMDRDIKLWTCYFVFVGLCSFSLFLSPFASGSVSMLVFPFIDICSTWHPLPPPPWGASPCGWGILGVAKGVSAVAEKLRELRCSSASSPDGGLGVLFPVLFTLDTFSSSASFLVHLFFSLPALPPKQFPYFPDIKRASLCGWMPTLQLMDEKAQKKEERSWMRGGPRRAQHFKY